MIRKIFPSVLLAAMTWLAWVPVPATAGQQALKARVQIEDELDYLLYSPDDHGDPKARFPLVVWLHGGNEGGHDIDKVRSSGMPRMIEAGRQFPFFVFSPQNPSEELLYPIERLESALREVLANPRIDRSRVYVIGYSRGGFGAWALAEQFPGRFAAIVSIAGGANLQYLNRTSEKTAYRMFHGTDDDVIPLSVSALVHERLRSLKRNTRLTVYEGVGHAAVESIALNDEGLWRWLLEQRLDSTP